MLTHAEIWERVVLKVRAGVMPPAGMPRPDRATLAKYARLNTYQTELFAWFLDKLRSTLLVSMLDRVGVRADRLGDSTGRLADAL